MTASMSFYADTHTTVRLSEYGTHHAPILALNGEDHTLTVSAFHHVPIADHLSFARELAAACADYVKALEAYATALSDGEQEPDEDQQ
ncbi:hypothetical protein BN159_4276 [Streptomyces davaonensis JCM 4913]|uniref:Uncharacterized protein n=1 Tax=Streptomyces davaonensis (strain DSM 101723 / JCM 4913 / KCC S-0913 / 768) TaxID=1214101 RepID=K4R6E0_STRDJ|nr:hypothetical protein [Streptomyces davaonensis]CCK28655.1 hypothetical protein BN159_4276 [Streptomyces davaonensis JCM 4913]